MYKMLFLWPGGDNITSFYSLSICKKKIWRIIFMTSKITPPSNITNLFGNWLNVVPRKIRDTLMLMCAPYYGLYGMWEMILFLTGHLFYHFYMLSPWLHTGSICGLFSSRTRSALLWIFGAAYRNGCVELIQPVWLAVWPEANMMMQRRFLISLLFKWLIHVETLCDPWL
jgi:hypothetical protein